MVLHRPQRRPVNGGKYSFKLKFELLTEAIVFQESGENPKTFEPDGVLYAVVELDNNNRNVKSHRCFDGALINIVKNVCN